MIIPFTFFSGSIAANYKAAVLADSPAMVWALNETTGTSAADISGNARTGTYTSCTLNQSGPATDGSVTSVAIPSGSYVSPASYIFNSTVGSWECWINVSSVSSSSVNFLFGCVNGPGSGIEDKIIEINTAGTPQSYAYDGMVRYAASATAFTLNAWNHVVGVCDGSNISLYVNGVQVAAAACGSTYAGYTVPNVFVGSTNQNDIPTPMKACWCAVYSTALSAARILAHYKAMH